MPLTIDSRLHRSLLALSVAALALTGCASAPGAQPSGQSSSSAPTSSAEAPEGTCTYVNAGRPAAKPVTVPPTEPLATGEVALTVKTSAGDLAVTLDADAAPCTVNSFLSLADQSYFSGTSCHRLTTAGIFVLQCGDPSGSGRGGPGYSFEDELTGTETYGAGTLAMANAGPDTNGSQFFIVYDESMLAPNYTVFGHLDEASTKIVADLAADGTDTGSPDGAPKTPVTITGVDRG